MKLNCHKLSIVLLHKKLKAKICYENDTISNLPLLENFKTNNSLFCFKRPTPMLIGQIN